MGQSFVTVCKAICVVDLSWLYSVSAGLPMDRNGILRSLDVAVRDHPVDRPCLWFDMVRWMWYSLSASMWIVANHQCFHICAFVLVQVALPLPPSCIILGTTVVRRLSQFPLNTHHFRFSLRICENPKFACRYFALASLHFPCYLVYWLLVRAKSSCLNHMQDANRSWQL